MAFSFTFPPTDESVLKNGLRLLLVPDHEQEALVIAAQFPFGRFCDPVSKEGISEMVVALMQKGTNDCPFDQFSEKLEYAGASLFSDVGEEHTGVGIRMLSKNIKEILPLFFDTICKPRLDEQEFQRLKKEMITSIQAEAAEPSLIANRHFYVELAGKEHPAGRFHSIDSIKSLRLSDIRNFFNEYVIPKDCNLVVAGDFDVQQFKDSFLDLLSAWSSVCSHQSCSAPEVRNTKTAFRLIDKQDTTQTTLIVGHAVGGELSPDRNNLALANYILGAGNFSSRLMTSIRSRVGRTYGISSQIAAERYFGAFTISTTTQNNQLEAMVDAVLEQFNSFCKEGVTADELDKAKRFAIGNMAFQLEGIGNVAEKLLWLRFYNHSNSFIEQFDQMINSISIDSVNASVKTTFSPEKLIIIAVGKKSDIAEQLKKFGSFKMFNFRDKV